MIIDIVIISLVVYGLAKLLNGVVFKTSPASPLVSWLMAIFILIASFFGYFFAQVFLYSAIAASLGVPELGGSGPKPNFILPFLDAWLFLATLNKKSKVVGTQKPLIHKITAAEIRHSDTSKSASEPLFIPSSPVAGIKIGIATRLEELQHLRDGGLITEVEYESKRKLILADI